MPANAGQYTARGAEMSGHEAVRVIVRHRMCAPGLRGAGTAQRNARIQRFKLAGCFASLAGRRGLRHVQRLDRQHLGQGRTLSKIATDRGQPL